MKKTILDALEKSMTKRKIKIPALAKKLGIPKDRMYKWYQEGTLPKSKDSVIIWNWINEDETLETISIFDEDEVDNSLSKAEMMEIINAQRQIIIELKEKLRNPTSDSADKKTGS